MADEILSLQVYPDKGTVCFSAGLHGWAFTLTVFAKLYAKKVGKCWRNSFLGRCICCCQCSQ